MPTKGGRANTGAIGTGVFIGVMPAAGTRSRCNKSLARFNQAASLDKSRLPRLSLSALQSPTNRLCARAPAPPASFRLCARGRICKKRVRRSSPGLKTLEFSNALQVLVLSVEGKEEEKEEKDEEEEKEIVGKIDR